MHRKQLNKSEIKGINENLCKEYGIEDFISKKDNAELVEGKQKLLMVDGKPYFFVLGEKFIPTLKLILEKNFLKIITVDMGAVKFVVSGADIMRPGITNIEEGIEKDQIIVIVDETHKKPLAIGKAMFSGEEMEKLESGKVIKNLHYIGDEIWE